MGYLEDYYGKYNEEKRLLRPYGRVEYLTTMKYIEHAIGDRKGLEILDVGAGTGRYAVPLAEEGHSVTAVELVPYNLGILRQKAEKAGLKNLIGKQGNALNLRKYPSDHYDLVLFLGPMYHLFTEEEKIRALSEARRVLKPGGSLFVAYIMNEFGVMIRGFREGAVLEVLKNGKLDPDTFHIRNTPEDLFSFDRTEDMERYRLGAGLIRQKLISADGPTNYIREAVTAMDEETFRAFLAFHYATCERPDLLGAGNHCVDILTKDRPEEDK